MNKFILLSAFALSFGSCISAQAGKSPGRHPVKGYTKRDGTYVRPHMAGSGPLASSSGSTGEYNPGLTAEELQKLMNPSGLAPAPVIDPVGDVDFSNIIILPPNFFRRPRRKKSAPSSGSMANLRGYAGVPAPSSSMVPATDAETARAASVKVYFSPNGGCTDAIVSEIDAAKSSIWIEGYDFTAAPILSALVRAKGRGVFVAVLLDRSNETAQFSGASFVSDYGMKVLIDQTHTLAHNEVMVVDDEVLLTGSLNFSASAESNAENLLVMRNCPELIDDYDAQFRTLIAQSRPFVNARTGASEVSPVVKSSTQDADGY